MTDTETKSSGRSKGGVFFMEPIREYFLEWYDSLRAVFANPRQCVLSFITLWMVVFSALMIWRGLTVVTISESPIVVVLSGSMEPCFYRGDLLYLTLHDDEPYRAGDVVVFKIEGKDIPIVHRIIQSHREDNTDYGKGFKLLTKGDNNSANDRSLYAVGQNWVLRKHILGKAKAFLPSIGMVTIMMNEYPLFKYLLLGSLALVALTNREE